MKTLVVLLMMSMVAFGSSAMAPAESGRLVDEHGSVSWEWNQLQPAPSTETTETKQSTVSEIAKVELYITTWCGYCRKAREFLQSKDISFIEYDIEKDPQAASRKEEISGWGGIPVAVINGQVIRGFSKATYERALKSRP